jgi:hypothetical protein
MLANLTLIYACRSLLRKLHDAPCATHVNKQGKSRCIKFICNQVAVLSGVSFQFAYNLIAKVSVSMSPFGAARTKNCDSPSAAMN